MKTTIVSALLLVIPGTAALSTEYKTGRALRIEIDTDLKLEMTTMEIEVDGEKQEGPGGGASSHATRKEVHVDTVVEAKEGQPTKVRRAFEAVGGHSETVFGENSRESDLESPLEGVTLEIVHDGDKTESTAVEGGSPDSKSLEGHRADLFLDALLPAGDVKADDTWDLDSETIRRALRLDLSAALFPPPAPTEGEGEGGGGGGRRRGMGRGGDAGLLTRAEWKGTAKLVSMDHDVDGTACAEIELKLEASGDMPEPERGGGGGRGERAFSPEIALPAAGSTYSIDLEGKFYFAVKERRPVSLDLEGSAKIERDNERKRGETTMRMHSVQEGSVKILVKVAEEKASEEK